jgi:PAS domain S-box-containing protein
MESNLFINCNILIVDDNLNNIKLLTEILESSGYKTNSAYSGEEALLCVNDKLTSLILLDIKLPGIKGFEVCRKLKTDERTRSIPVFLLSAFSDEASKAEGFRAGAVDFISKPFFITEILAKVKTHIELRQRQLDLEKQNERLKEINERKQAEEEVEYKGTFIRALMDNIPGAIYFKDLQSKFILVNRSWAAKYGNSDPDSYTGLTDFDVFSRQHAQQAYDDEQTIIRTGKACIDIEEEETYPDRPSSWVITSKMLLYGKNQQIIGTFGISVDITKRKLEEAALSESEQRFRTLSDSTSKESESLKTKF